MRILLFLGLIFLATAAGSAEECVGAGWTSGIASRGASGRRSARRLPGERVGVGNGDACSEGTRGSAWRASRITSRAASANLGRERATGETDFESRRVGGDDECSLSSGFPSRLQVEINWVVSSVEETMSAEETLDTTGKLLALRIPFARSSGLGDTRVGSSTEPRRSSDDDGRIMADVAPRRKCWLVSCVEDILSTLDMRSMRKLLAVCTSDTRSGGPGDASGVSGMDLTAGVPGLGPLPRQTLPRSISSRHPRGSICFRSSSPRDSSRVSNSEALNAPLCDDGVRKALEGIGSCFGLITCLGLATVEAENELQDG